MDDTWAKVITAVIVGVPTAWWLGKFFHGWLTGTYKFYVYQDGYSRGYDDGDAGLYDLHRLVDLGASVEVQRVVVHGVTGVRVIVRKDRCVELEAIGSTYLETLQKANQMVLNHW